jgi:hypothetical protein
VLAPLRVLQSNLGALRGLAALDVSALGAESFAQTESLLFGSREAARTLQGAMKEAEHARPAVGSQTASGPQSQSQPQAQAQATRQLLAALSGAIEKAASILLAKHKQHEMDERTRSHSSSSETGGGSVGAKRKQGGISSGPCDSLAFSSTHKRVRGGIIAPPPSSSTAAGAAPLSGPAAQPAVPLTLEQRVEAALTRVQSLQQLQEQLQRNADTLAPNIAKSNSSGSNTPSRRGGAPLRSTHTQPLSVASGLRASDLTEPESRMDDEPAGSLSSRSDASNESMSSEADSEAAVAQRANMLSTLAANVRACNGASSSRCRGKHRARRPHQLPMLRPRRTHRLAIPRCSTRPCWTIRA